MSEKPVLDNFEHRDPILWAFENVYHLDKANACIHCAPVRFSPLTFRLVEELLMLWPQNTDITPEMAEVKWHKGQYEEDTGR